MQNDFNLCPICGSKNIKNLGGRAWACPDCNFKLYNNVASAVGIIIQDKDGNVILEKRVKDPGAGLLTIPGGFCDADENAEEAALRECKEELGIGVNDIKYLCSFPNNYEYKNILYKTCDMYFTANLDTNKNQNILESLTLQKSEVQSLVLKKIEGAKDVLSLPLAFESTKKALMFWAENK